MKFSENELKKLFVGKLKLSTETLCHQLTMLGLEVESCESVAPAFTGVVIGEILEAAQHPNADRLRVCKVNTGIEPILQIVCGAPNARAGIKVAVSTVGACLPGNFKIKEGELRGVKSEGMLCGSTELGLPEGVDGIMELPLDAPLGVSVREYLDLDDQIIEINLTPNRGDCLSLYGIAREIAVLNQLSVPALTTKPVTAKGDYLLASIEGVDNAGSTPNEIQTRLARSGIRSVSPVVDILNDVMILTGQPMHAFDADMLEGDLSVSFASEGEKVLLLNDEEVTLRKETVTIRDAKGIVALAGIMGDKKTSVTENTKRILVEAAFFDPLVIAGRARTYGLHTDSSHRFERGVDPALAPQALALAIEKIANICGGKLTEVRGQELQHSRDYHTRKPIKLRLAKIKQLLGLEVEGSKVQTLLETLGCHIIQASPETLNVEAPSWRFDLQIEEDLIEEVARLVGYDAIPTTLPRFELMTEFVREAETPNDRIKDFLSGMGFHEVVSYSFIDEDMQKHFFDEPQYVLENPIVKELASMRKSLVPSHLKILLHNLNRQQSHLKIFELAERFVGAEATQVNTLAGLCYGKQEAWMHPADFDFYDLKGYLEKLFALSRLKVQFDTRDLPEYIHPGQGQVMLQRGKKVGYFGALHPGLVQVFELEKTPFVFEMNAVMFQFGEKPKLKPISKFPAIERDLAFLTARDLPAEKLLLAVKSVKSPIFKSVAVFDVYAGKNLPADQKSVAIKITLQAEERTLVDEEVNQFIATVIEKIANITGAVLRV